LNGKISRRIFKPKRNDEGGYDIRSNKELFGVFNACGELKTNIYGGGGEQNGDSTEPDQGEGLHNGERYRVEEDRKLLGALNGKQLAVHREKHREIVGAVTGLNGLE